MNLGPLSAKSYVQVVEVRGFNLFISKILCSEAYDQVRPSDFQFNLTDPDCSAVSSIDAPLFGSRYKKFVLPSRDVEDVTWSLILTVN